MALLNFGEITAAFDLRLQLAFTVGVVLSSPVWLYQLWAFIVPALTRREKGYALGFVGAAVPLFAAGCAAGWLVLPHMISLLVGFAPSNSSSILNARSYVDFILRLMLIVGIAFVLPLLLVLLNVVGVMSASRHHRLLALRDSRDHRLHGDRHPRRGRAVDVPPGYSDGAPLLRRRRLRVGQRQATRKSGRGARAAGVGAHPNGVLMFGLDPTKLFLLAILAAFLLGPSRMTAAAAWLGAAVRQLRAFTEAAKQRARDEIGEEFDDIAWKALDPRQYDPRRIIADAMLAPPAVPRAIDAARKSRPERTTRRTPRLPPPDSRHMKEEPMALPLASVQLYSLAAEFSADPHRLARQDWPHSGCRTSKRSTSCAARTRSVRPWMLPVSHRPPATRRSCRTSCGRPTGPSRLPPRRWCSRPQRQSGSRPSSTRSSPWTAG